MATLDAARRLVAICSARARVAAALAASSGALKPATTGRYADRDMRHSETGIDRVGSVARHFGSRRACPHLMARDDDHNLTWCA